MKAKKWLLAMAVVGAMAVVTESAWAVSGTSAAVTVRSLGGYDLDFYTEMEVGYPPFSVGDGDRAGIWLDGEELFSSVGDVGFDWTPLGLGAHALEFRLNGVAVTSKTVNVYGDVYVDGPFSYAIGNGKAIVTGVEPTGGNLVIPASLGGSPVTGIGDFAFSGCGGLTSVTIPAGITHIGTGVFDYCIALREILVETGNLYYASRDGVLFDKSGYELIAFPAGKKGSYSIPGGVESIGPKAFMACSGLTSVAIPNGVTSIGEAAFWQCSGLTNMVIPSGVTHIASDAFFDCSSLASVTIPFGVECIGNDAFSRCSGLTSVGIPSSVTSIGINAFSGCSGLTSVTIPASVTNIGSGAFEYCSHLAEIRVDTGNLHYASRDGVLFDKAGNELVAFPCGKGGSYSIPNGVENIGWGAFLACSGLTAVTIPTGVTNIGDFAFFDCDGLGSVEIPFGVTRIGERTFADCRGLATVTIPGSVTSIGSGAFSACSSLKDVAIPFGVERIEEDTFWKCTSLRTVAIPGSVESIGTEAFAGCVSLREVSVPQCVCSGRLADVFPDGYAGLTKVVIDEGVTSIARQLFDGCNGLLTVTIPGSVENIEAGTFDGCASLKEVGVPQCVCSGRLADVFPAAYAGIEMVTVSEGVREIADGAFAGCDSLRVVNVPESLMDWGVEALPDALRERLAYDAAGFLVYQGWVLGHRNPEVSSIAVPNGMVGIGRHALANFWDLESVTFPETLRAIARGAFETNTYLDNVTIPNGVKHIGNGAFQGCTYLRELVIGEGVEQIGTEAFSTCTQLATVTVPESVRGIGDRAFSNCWRMLSVKLPLGLETVGTKIFAGCRSLTGVTMPTHAFTAARLFEDRYQALASVTVAAGETLVCDNAFSNCTALSSVSLPSSLEEIGNGAFKSCSSLTEIELPGDALARIGEEAFSGAGLTAIVLPDSVTQLGTKAFRNCTTLQNASLSRSLETLPDYVFEGCSKLSTMVVPASMKTLGKGLGNYFQGLYFLGNAPAYDADAYKPRQKSITTYVVRGTRGWDGIPSSRDLPESWLGYPITYWEPNRFDAHFNANGGAFSDGSEVWSCEQITGVGYVLPPQNPVLSGAEFDGWWTDPAEGARITVTTRVNETREITFYAHWKGSGAPVTVRFNANGGTVEPAERTYSAGLPYGELPVPTRAHYQFDGWWTLKSGGSKVTAGSRVPGADQELFAHWTAETYTIRYHANGGTGTMDNQTFTIGKAQALGSCQFARTGFFFLGWATESGGDAVYADGETVLDLTSVPGRTVVLYATWGAAPLALSASARSFTWDAAAGQELRVVASVAWTAKSSASWLTVRTASGSGNGKIVYDVAENPGTETRQATITVSGGGLSLAFTVTQGGRSVAAVLTLEASSWSGGAEAASNQMVRVTANVAWTAESSAEWLTVRTASGSGNGSIVFDVAANTGTWAPPYLAEVYNVDENMGKGPRLATITVTGGGWTRSFTVTQDGAADGWSSVTIDGIVLYYTTSNGCAEVVYAKHEREATYRIALSGDIAIPEFLGGCPVTSIGRYAFSPVSGHNAFFADPLHVSFPDSVTNVGDHAFLNCWGLVDMMLPASLTCIENYAFSSCESLATLTIPDQVTSIGDSAFSYCTNLASAFVPESVTSLGRYAFSGCKVMQTLYVPVSWKSKYVDGTFWSSYAGVRDGCEIVYYGAFPDVSDVLELAAALADAADARLAERIATVEEYDAFRAWIAAKGLDGEAVKASAQAWASYLLGAETLFENEPNIQIAEMWVGERAWTVRVAVKDGEQAAVVDAGKVAELFQASRQMGDWTGEKRLPLEVEEAASDGDGLLFVVTPTAEVGGCGFLRVGETLGTP